MANTPFLDLVKPTDTDQALITDINNNSDKIDTGVSTLSEQIATYQISSQSSYADLQNALKTFAATIADYQTHPISVVAGFGDAIFTNNRTYIGQLYKRNATNISVLLTSHLGDTIRGSCASDTWTWEQLATTEQVEAKINCKRVQIPSNSSMTVTLPNNTTFFIFATRLNVESTSAEGIYIGSTGANNEHISPIGTAASALTMSISNHVLTMSASTSNLVVTIIYM